MDQSSYINNYAHEDIFLTHLKMHPLNQDRHSQSKNHVTPQKEHTCP